MKRILSSLAGGLKKIGSHSSPRPGRPRRRRPATRPTVEHLECRLTPAGPVSVTHIWIGGDISRTDGDARAHPNDPNAPVEWSNANNWLDGNVPGPNDTALFTANTGSYTFPDADPGPPPTVDQPITYTGPSNDSPLVDGNFTVASLQVNSSAAFSMTVASGESLTLTGTSEWDIGTITVQNTGAFINASSGTLTVGGSTVLVTGTLTNQGTVVQQASGNIQLGSGTLDNQPGAFWKLKSDVGFLFDNNLPGVFNNSGTVIKVGGTGTSDLFSDGGFNNLDGTIEADSGTLIPWNGGNGVSTGGTFIVGPNGNLLYANANIINTFTGTYTNGPSTGHFVHNRGGINIGSSGATFNFDPGFFQWQGGDIDVTGTTLINSGSITADTTSATPILTSGSPGTLKNSGTLVLTGKGVLAITGNSTLVNPAGGLIDIQDDTGITSSNSLGANSLTNQGTVQKSGGSGTSDITLIQGFNNQGGTLSANSGTLVPWDGGGTNTGGLFTANGGTLQFFDNNTGATFTGTYTNGPSTGHLVLSRGGVNIGSSGAAFKFDPGFFQWQGGDIDTSKGTLTNSGSITVDTSAATPILTLGTLLNNNTLTVIGKGAFAITGAATLVNPTGGLLDIQDDATITSSNSSGGLNNQGTVQKSGGSGTSDITLSLGFNNQGGTLSANSGTLVPWDGGGTNTGGLFTANGGTLQFFDTGANATFTGSYTNGPSTGHLVHNRGTIDTGSSGATFNFTPGFFQWQGGSIDTTKAALTNSGSITVDTAGSPELFFGTLQNNGTLALINTGDLFILGAATLVNPTGGLIDIQNDAGISSSNSSGGLNNQGTVQKSGGSGVSDIVLSLGFNNQGGTLLANSGTLVPWDGGGTNTGGVFTANGGTLQFFDTGASATFTGTYTNGPSTGHLVHNRGGINIGSSGATFNFAPGFFQWQSGDIDTSKGTLTNSGSITVDTSAATPILTLGTLLNNNTLTVIGKGAFAITGAATLVNPTGGLLDIQDDATITSSNSSGGLNNQGTVQKSGGSGTSDITLSLGFNNQGGTLSANSGTLVPWDGGGTNTGGLFTANGGTLQFFDTGANATFTGSYTNGPSTGHLVHNRGTIDTGSSGATFNFTPGFFQWQGGSIDTTKAALTNSGSITVDTAGSPELFFGTLQNNGTLALINTGDLFILGAATLVNPTGGLIDIQNDAGISSSNSSGGLNNQGTVQKSGGSGVSDIVLSLGFNNQGGTLLANSGTLVPWDGGGTNTGGVFTANGGTLQFFDTGASATFTGTYTNGPSTGHLVHNRGGINIGSSGATFNFAPGFFQWQSGDIDTSKGTLTNSGSITVDTSGSPELFFGTLQNNGTLALIHTGDLFILGAATLVNPTGGLIDIQNDASISSSNSSGGLNNQGTLQKSGGSGTSVIVLSHQLNNTGTVSVLSGFLDSQITAQVSGNTLTGGTWNVFANATLRVNGGTNLTVNNGNITLSGPGSVFTNIANLATNNGSFSLLGGQGFTTVGDLANNGSITLGPGDTLTVSGNYTHGSTANLNIQIGGANAGQFGVLVATKALNLNGNGNLNVSLVNGFLPSTGNTFKILIFTSRNGDFAAKNGLVISPSLSLEPVYHSGDLTLVASAPPKVASFVINDGNVQRSMINSLTITFSTVVTLDNGAIEVDLQGGGQEGLVLNTSVVNGHTVVVVTFTGVDIIGGSLGDGRYTLIVHSAKVHTAAGQTLDGTGSGTAGSDHVEHFFRLFGDVNGDGKVDNFDLAFFRSTFGKHAGQAGYLWFLDYDQNGVVDINDFNQFKLRYGHSI